MKYITYHIRGLGINTPIAVDCSNIKENLGYEIYFDADSLAGLKNVTINNCGKIRKDAIVITPQEHYTYDWGKLEKMFYNANYNPEFFVK